MTVASPCVKNCCLDKQDVCIGCGRTVEEIVLWGDSDDDEKIAILDSAKQRMKQREKSDTRR